MRVLFVNSTEPACGVFQFGLNLWRILEPSRAIQFNYAAPVTLESMMRWMDTARPDVVLMNFYPSVIPWVTLQALNAIRARGVKIVTIYHEVPVTGFDALLYPDPTFTGKYRKLNQWFGFGRPLPKARAERPCLVPSEPLISTSGFGFGWKGHERLTEMVVREFSRATLRLHLPFAKYGDADGGIARATAQRCRDIVKGTLIDLQIDHDFMEPEAFIDWLAESDLNAYLYDETNSSRGIASTTDHALAARRPIALTRTHMFRHLHQCEGIFVEESSLWEIMARGIEPLRPAYEQFSEANVLREVEQILGALSQEKFNRLLTNRDREQLVPVIEEMTKAVPEMMGRKIPAANVQQAWVLETVRKTNAERILCVGCFEDTAFETLRATGTYVTGIDPESTDPGKRATLSEFSRITPKDWSTTYDCIFSTSVIEHVLDDGQFIRDLCDFLRPDGVCILTADYRADWKAGQPLPATDVRLYTPADIERIARVLESKGCYFVDPPNLEGAPDFHYQGHDYSFVALVFKKL
jgi:SAM-dependent methyltransferase